MAHASLPALVRYCDSLLRTDAVRDWERAHNGLQVENDGRVRVIDCKGHRTKGYRTKRRQMREYRGIQIEEA